MWSPRLAAAPLVVADGTVNQVIPAAPTGDPDETLHREPDDADPSGTRPPGARDSYPQRLLVQYGPAPRVRLPLIAEPASGRIRNTVTPTASPVG